MIFAGDFRKGVTFEMEGKVYTVVDFLHVKPGKGAAFVRAKIKNVMTGQVLELTFNPSSKYESARIETKKMQYLFNSDGLYTFMDTDTYDQIELNYDVVEEAMKYVKEEMTVTVQF
jgi:elongation factor P